MDTTEEASADQYGLDQETLDKLLDRSDIVKVKSFFDCQICTQVHHITIFFAGVERKGWNIEERRRLCQNEK